MEWAGLLLFGTLAVLVHQTHSDIIIEDVIKETEPGCIAYVKTKLTEKWIYLYDDLTMANDSM